MLFLSPPLPHLGSLSHKGLPSLSWGAAIGACTWAKSELLAFEVEKRFLLKNSTNKPTTNKLPLVHCQVISRDNLFVAFSVEVSGRFPADQELVPQSWRQRAWRPDWRCNAMGKDRNP